jgi:hypothetical protein
MACRCESGPGRCLGPSELFEELVYPRAHDVVDRDPVDARRPAV